MSEESSLVLAVKKISIKSAKSARAPETGIKVPTRKKVLYSVDDLISPEVERRPISERPVTWRDIAAFGKKHGRSQPDLVYDLTLQTLNTFAKRAKEPRVVPFDLEILLRLYDMFPESCRWKHPDIRVIFARFYKAKINRFKPELRPNAQAAYTARFSMGLGRANTAHYRWFSDSEPTTVTRRIRNILTIFETMYDNKINAEAVFDKLARESWALRGVDYDLACPVPNRSEIELKLRSKGRKTSARMLSPATQQPAQIEMGGWD
jgi:hypothetical protein